MAFKLTFSLSICRFDVGVEKRGEIGEHHKPNDTSNNFLLQPHPALRARPLRGAIRMRYILKLWG
jgi:hypothetical protein